MKKNRQQRILYVITKSNFGGAQRYVFDLATGISSQDYEVVVAFGGNGILKEKLQSAGIKTRTIQNFERDIGFVKEIRALFELAQIIREERPDIIHLNSSKAGGSGALVARILSVPHIIFTAHGWAFLEKRGIVWRSVIWFFSWFTALLAHSIIVVSQTDYTCMHMPWVSKKTTRVHTAVPPIHFLPQTEARTSLFTPLVIAQHKNDFWLASTSELTPNKNLLTALQAVKVFNATSARKIFFVLMGTGELRDTLEKYVREQTLENAIAFLGYVENAPYYLKAFDAFILPSLKEGLPYGLLEAGSACLPCIASRVGGIPEIIDHEKSGLLVDPTNLTEIVSALEKCVTHPEHTETYGRALQKKVLLDFSLTDMIIKTEKIYSR